jgi:pyruvate/2-oxoglutarate dehydrogenase complex dihydrolipoamide dehydrogenase (E3) component
VEMAQAIRRFGGEVVLVEGAAHILSREPRPLGEALADVLRRDGVELDCNRRWRRACQQRHRPERLARRISDASTDHQSLPP